MRDVSGKVAVITGAASGIGFGMAESFAAAGMKVVLADVEEKALMESTAVLRDSGADVHSVLTDVSKLKQVQALADETLKKYGAVHVLCNNAGVCVTSTSTWEASLDDWKWTIDVNLMGAIYGIRTFIPIMLEQKSESHIVNTASLDGLTTHGSSAMYAVTKFGGIALSEHIYLELANIGAKTKVSVLCPGFVPTNIFNYERNRPIELQNKSPQLEGPIVDIFLKWYNENAGVTKDMIEDGPIVNIFLEWFDDQIQNGLSPRNVGDQVLSAIREERFYILTHPDWNYLIEHRVRAILDGRNPSIIPRPGMEPLMEKLAKVLQPA